MKILTTTADGKCVGCTAAAMTGMGKRCL